MIIVSKQNQNNFGLSSDAIALIDQIRLVSSFKVPNTTNISNFKVYNHRYIYHTKMNGVYERTLKIHHKKLNNDYSIAILLKVNAAIYTNSVAHCWVYNNNFSIVYFALKEGMNQAFEVYDDIRTADKFLDRKDFYQKLIHNIQKELFKSI